MQEVVCVATLGLCPKVQKIVCEAPPTIEVLIESKVEDMIQSKVEECFQYLISKSPLVQYTLVCGALVTKSALLVPNEEKNIMVQLEDPSGMVGKYGV